MLLYRNITINILNSKNYFLSNCKSKELFFLNNYWGTDRVSKASRNPLPNKVNDNTVKAIATPGQIAK